MQTSREAKAQAGTGSRVPAQAQRSTHNHTQQAQPPQAQAHQVAQLQQAQLQQHHAAALMMQQGMMGAGGASPAAAQQAAQQYAVLMQQQQQFLQNQMAQQAAAARGEENTEDPLYVNAKQYHRILKRRQARAKLEAENKIPKNRKAYLHKSRHDHACKRQRGNGGRFETKKSTATAKDKK